ncbi:MAG: right-handed parallel beta-helix repeat-containing protein [Planctomycetales bacterium]|nr:right-handed parallel beta-helix repeat-containing protein [Planctomycetales bacterium]
MRLTPPIPTLALFALLAALPTLHARDVTEFLPAGFVRDGSVSYQHEIQRAIDAAAQSGQSLVFPAMTYAASEQGWQLRSNLVLNLHGAVFQLPANCESDGAVFRGHDVTEAKLAGGEILGQNDQWQDGVNVRGIHITGSSRRIRIADMTFRNLSSNAVGIFGNENHLIRDVWLENLIVENCCKRYPDYLSEEKPEPNSQREDQGDVALYYVEDFLVRGCRFERSRSDGTHFYRCRQGQILANRIYRAKMGGYFLETCENVVGIGNLMIENGSRGTTIERGSKNCVFTGNVVSGSGREGLWAPDCVGLVVTANTFRNNGRKPNGPELHHIWNANITINEAKHDPSNSPTRDYLVSNNLLDTTADQIAAVRVVATADTRSIVIRHNLLLGENQKIVIEGPKPSAVQAEGNGDLLQ